MRQSKMDSTRISFGRLSQQGVLNKSPLANPYKLNYDAFSTRNFQYIVDNVVDMFGYEQGTIKVFVEANDFQKYWIDYNNNGKIDSAEGEIVIAFTLNAQIEPYERISTYGKNFMFSTAMQYGYPIIFGIVAHEVGHLINNHALTTREIRTISGKTALFETATTEDYWDELCADYLAGITLALSNPPLEHSGFKAFLVNTLPDESHPSGFYRQLAIEMGYQWGSNNPSLISSVIIGHTEYQRQLLESFFISFYKDIYCNLDSSIISQYGYLPTTLRKPINNMLRYT